MITEVKRIEELPAVNSPWTLGAGYLCYSEAKPVLRWYERPIYWFCQRVGIKYPVYQWHVNTTFKPSTTFRTEYVVNVDSDKDI